MARILDLRVCLNDAALAAFVLGVEHDRRRTWPALGKTYDEPTIVYGSTLWTLNGLIAHLGLTGIARDGNQRYGNQGSAAKAKAAIERRSPRTADAR